MNLLKTFFVIIILNSLPIIAHEPLFMMSHEAPGRGAFDTHTSLVKNSMEDELELETEFGWGLTRNTALKFEIPLVFLSENSSAGIADPVVNFKWRFWDKDSLGQKYAIAWAIKGSIPIGSNDDLILGNERPFFESGMSHGMESLHYYYFVDLRYHYNVAHENSPGDRLHLDFAPGWRPFLAGLEENDYVFFLEINYVHFFEGNIKGNMAVSSQDIVYLTPDFLLSTSNRLMFRLGAQFPIWKRKINLGPYGQNYKFSTEIRF